MKYKKSSIRRKKERMVSIYKQQHACKYCKAQKNLTFHHRNAREKSGNINELIRDEMVTVLMLRAEINKCDLVCLGCHRIIHLAESKRELAGLLDNHE